jgi:hypothetical protein
MAAPRGKQLGWPGGGHDGPTHDGDEAGGHGRDSQSTGSIQMQYRWWIPSDGIRQDVIQADIQRYLGQDALVEPSLGTGQDAVSGLTWHFSHALTSTRVNEATGFRPPETLPPYGFSKDSLWCTGQLT